MALATGKNHNIDIILISEPNKYEMKRRKTWLYDDRLDSGVIILNDSFQIKTQGKGEGFTYVKINDIDIFSCYSSGNQDIERLEVLMNEISTTIRRRGTKAVIAGDFNSKSSLWTSSKCNKRGALMEEWIAENNLVLLNQREKATFECENYSSVLDLSLVTPDLYVHVTSWDVIDEESLSDHKYIVFEVTTTGTFIEGHLSTQGWQVRKLNEQKLNEVTNSIKWQGEITAGKFSEKLVEICNSTMPKRTISRRGRPVYWWTSEIAALRKECLPKRRKYTRVAGGNSLILACNAWNDYQTQRKKLRNAIKQAKKAAWKRLINEIDKDIWGDGYKIAIRSTIGYPPTDSIPLERMEMIARNLFPPPGSQLRSDGNQVTAIEVNHTVINNCDNESVIVLSFTMNELEEAISRMKEKKAPGPGLVPPEILKLLSTKRPEYVLELYNKLAREGIFPAQWKMAKLILIPKGNRVADDPSAYRTISLLDVEGKMYELLLLAKLEKEIERTGGLSNNQYGFRRGRQTIDAITRVLDIAKEADSFSWKYRRLCAVLTLDVKNAFNCAEWDQILEILYKRGMDNSLICVLNSYLSERKIVLEAKDGKKVMEIKRGVPQGSILGPVLWNLLYDDLFRLNLPEEVTLIGFADDVAMVVVAKTEEKLMVRANSALGMVSAWMKGRHLELAPNKTEAVLLTRKRKIAPIEFELEGTCIRLSKVVKYLGVWLDTKFTFSEHITKIVEKASKTVTGLSKIMPNINGPSSSKRRVLSSVVHSKILYAAPIWHTILQNKNQRTRLLSLQRTMAIRVCSAYRTISTAAVGVIAGMPPIDLMAMERKEKYDGVAKEEARRNLLRRWQERWEQGDTGRWTYSLIPNVELWIKRPYGEVDYFITQALSGHGNFNKYLFEKQRRDTAECNYCSEEDDVEHTLFECIRWNDAREGYLNKTGKEFTKANMQRELTTNEEGWRYVYDMVRYVIENKAKDDEQRGEA